MGQISYSNLEKYVGIMFRQSRSKPYGLNIEQSIGRTMVEFERVTERSELEHLIVFLSLSKLVQEEQTFDEELYQVLLTHHENRTVQTYRADLTPEDSPRLTADLESLLENWK